MKPFSKIIQQANPSKFVNTWKVATKSKHLLITPAHVAIYKKNDQWVISKFLRDFKALDWHVPVQYLLKFEDEDDIAWAEIPASPEDTFLEFALDEVVLPTNVDFFFRQPYNANGQWVDNPTFGSMNSVLYPSPESNLLEALDVGFRGMSGAVAVKHNTRELVGMFVGKGIPIELKKGAPLPDFMYKRFKKGEESSEHVLREEKKGSAEDLLSQLSSTDSKIIMEFLLETHKKIDSKINTVDSKISTVDLKINTIDQKVQFLVDNALKKGDLDQLLNGIALRRGVVIPSRLMLKHIDESQSIEISRFAKFQDH